jgi:hypothetical protein
LKKLVLAVLPGVAIRNFIDINYLPGPIGKINILDTGIYMSIQFLSNNTVWTEKWCPILLERMATSVGEKRPALRDSDEPWKKNQFQKWYDLGYDVSGAEWTMHYWNDLGMSSANDFELPFTPTGNTVEWWLAKINPAKTFPWHTDAFKAEASNFRRFWISIQDFTPGHVFVYDDKILAPYKAGDIFEFTDPRVWHAAANLAYKPKITLQIVTYDL